jgi:ABC-2 type transport system permease protein
MQHLREYWKPYWGVVRAGLANAVEYRTNFFIDTVAWLLVSGAVNMYLWFAVYESSHESVLASITLPQMLAYIATATLCASICRKGRFERATGEEIRSGELNKYLVKPITHIGYILAAATAERMISLQLTVILVIVVGVPLALATGVSLSLSGCLVAFPILLCGMMIHSLIALTLSYLAFWLDEVWTFHVVKDISFWFLSGQLLPLSALPPDAFFISSLLPFQYLAYVPASLMVGTIPASAALPYFAGALFWTALLYGGTLLIWKRGIMRYSAFGG